MMLQQSKLTKSCWYLCPGSKIMVSCHCVLSQQQTYEKVPVRIPPTVFISRKYGLWSCKDEISHLKNRRYQFNLAQTAEISKKNLKPHASTHKSTHLVYTVLMFHCLLLWHSVLTLYLFYSTGLFPSFCLLRMESSAQSCYFKHRCMECSQHAQL